MKASIITVSYNSESTIEQTIQSVISQSFDDLEYIIIDGGSTDGTLDIIKKYRSRIDTVVSEPDRGVYDAINKGITRTTNEVVGLLHADDIFENEETISAIMKPFIENDAIDMVYGNIAYFKSDPNSIERIWKNRSHYETYFEDGFVPPHPALFVRKRLYDRIGLYVDDFVLASDYEFMFRALKIHKVNSFYLDKNIVNMRLGGLSTRSWKNIIKGNMEVYKSWRRNGLWPPLMFWPKRILYKLRQ